MYSSYLMMGNGWRVVGKVDKDLVSFGRGVVLFVLGVSFLFLKSERNIGFMVDGFLSMAANLF